MNKTSIALVVTGALASLFAAGLLAVGGLALWGDSQKDDDGYLSTGTHPVSYTHLTLPTTPYV